MNLTTITAAFSLLAASTAMAACCDESEIFLADPTVFVDGGKYYMTGTSGDSSKGFVMLESDDMKTWKQANGGDLILKADGSTFGTTGFWAPQVYKDNGKYYFAYTANEQVALAESASITGPYVQKKAEPIDGSEKNIDPFIFKDNGKYYLYHVRFNHGNYLWVAEFDLKKGKIKKSTLKQCFPLSQAWEKTDDNKWDPIMEGPTVVKYGDTYYLFYSANHFLNKDYAVGYATAKSPMGPWTKYEGNPIISRQIVGENGSGHGDIFTGLDGKLYYVYHTHYSNETVTPRRTRIVPLLMEKDEATGLLKFSVDTKNKIIPILK